MVTVMSFYCVKGYTLFFSGFINLVLTCTFTLDEPELYNPLAEFKGQQQKGQGGLENPSPSGKKTLTSNFQLDLSV